MTAKKATTTSVYKAEDFATKVEPKPEVKESPSIRLAEQKALAKRTQGHERSLERGTPPEDGNHAQARHRKFKGQQPPVGSTPCDRALPPLTLAFRPWA